MFSRNRPPKTPTPNWVTWIIIGFVIFALISNNHKGAVHKSIEQASQNLAPEKLFHIEEYKKLFAYGETPRINDIAPGEGTPVICGQQVKIAYNAFLSDGTAIGAKASKDEPLTFHAGTDEAIPALAQSVIGMKPGGKRSMVSPANMAYDSKGHAREDVPKGTSVRFEIELLGVTPKLPDIEASPFRITNVSSGNGPAVACNDTIKIHATLWGIDGKKLYTTRDKGPITFTPGKSEVAIGLEQGVIGMAAGGVRTLIIPPAFQKTMNGNAPTVQLPFPKNQTVLVDVLYVP